MNELLLPSKVFKKWLLIVLFLTQIGIKAQNIFEATRSNDTTRIKFLYALQRDTINSVNESGFSPLIIAVYRQQSEAAKMLVVLGADLNANSPEGSALVAAAYKGDLNFLNLLLSKGANPNTFNEDGITALMYAAQLNYNTIVQSLLVNGAKKDLRSKAGYTALDYAKKNGHAELVSILSD